MQGSLNGVLIVCKHIPQDTCSEQVCRKCNARHHTLLHFDKYHRHSNARSVHNNAPTTAKGPSTHNKLTANEQNNAPTEVNTYCTFKGKPQNQVLLITAIVQLRNKSGHYVPCRALLDSASQSHFITERCVQRLRWSKTHSHQFRESVIPVQLQIIVFQYT